MADISVFSAQVHSTYPCNAVHFIFMITSVLQWYQSLYFPTNAHNVKT